MKFAALAQYTRDRSTIAKARPAHRQYLSGLLDQGKLVISGPFADDAGALLVYEADSREEVEAMVRGDPFATEGVFVSWEIRPWNVVFLNRNLLCGDSGK
jgi:uncharacterized protein YciI